MLVCRRFFASLQRWQMQSCICYTNMAPYSRSSEEFRRIPHFSGYCKFAQTVETGVQIYRHCDLVHSICPKEACSPLSVRASPLCRQGCKICTHFKFKVILTEWQISLKGSNSSNLNIKRSVGTPPSVTKNHRWEIFSPRRRWAISSIAAMRRQDQANPQLLHEFN